MNIRKITTGVAAVALATGGALALAAPASAHDAVFVERCEFVALQLSSYPDGSLVSGTVDGQPFGGPFGTGGFQDSVNFTDLSVSHSWNISVTSGDGDPAFAKSFVGQSLPSCITPTPEPEPTPPVITPEPEPTPPVVVPEPPVVEPTPTPEPTIPPEVVEPTPEPTEPVTPPTEQPTTAPVPPVQPTTPPVVPQAPAVPVAAVQQPAPVQLSTPAPTAEGLAYTGTDVQRLTGGVALAAGLLAAGAAAIIVPVLRRRRSA